MQEKGIPNYFGYQRFGEDGKSWQQGQEIAHSGKRLKGAKEKLLVSAYQSHLFNQWLSQRVNLSKVIIENELDKATQILSYPLPLIKELVKQPQFFKLFLGESLMQYPYGKQSYCKEMLHAAQRFERGEVAPTGLLSGDKAPRAHADARHLEQPHDDEELTSLRGDRRLAWIWPEHFSTEYISETQTLTVRFDLPRGCYATTLLEEIGKHSLKPERK
jgi:tRNA pseudouridine13 synthase